MLRSGLPPSQQWRRPCRRHICHAPNQPRNGRLGMSVVGVGSSTAPHMTRSRERHAPPPAGLSRDGRRLAPCIQPLPGGAALQLARMQGRHHWQGWGWALPCVVPRCPHSTAAIPPFRNAMHRTALKLHTCCCEDCTQLQCQATAAAAERSRMFITSNTKAEV